MYRNYLLIFQVILLQEQSLPCEHLLFIVNERTPLIGEYEGFFYIYTASQQSFTQFHIHSSI